MPSSTDRVRVSMTLLDQVKARVDAIAKAIAKTTCTYPTSDGLGPVPAASC